MNLVKTTVIPVRWGDIDNLGHVNNSCYFTYFEQTRIEWLSDLGYQLNIETQKGPVLVNAACTFIKEIKYPSSVIVKLYLLDPGRSSFMTHHEISLEDDPETIVAKGSAKVVWLDYKAGKSISMPENIRALMTE